MTDETIEPKVADAFDRLFKLRADLGDWEKVAGLTDNRDFDQVFSWVLQIRSGLTPHSTAVSAALRAQVIEECAKVADNYARDGRVYKEYACETADEIAARIRSLSAVSAIAQGRDVIDIVFDGPPGHEAGRFVEVEAPPGRSVRHGEWIRRENGYWALRIDFPREKENR